MKRWARGVLYCAGFVTWGLAVGGVGRLAAFIIQEIRERDNANTAVLWEPLTGRRWVAVKILELRPHDVDH